MPTCTPSVRRSRPYYLSLAPETFRRSKELLGHRSIAATQVYLRKFDKATAMERVRDLPWGDVAKPVNGSQPGSSEIAAKMFESLAGVGAGGFEPPFEHALEGLRRGGLRELLEALRRVLEESEVGR